MSAPIEAGIKSLSASFPETAIYTSDRGWSGRIDYQAYVKTSSVGTLGITFRWKDRGGVTLIIASNGFQLWTQNADPSTVTLTLALAGLIGTPVIDFFANGFGVNYD